MAYLGKTPSQAVRSRYYFTATGGETSLSGTDDNSNTLTFTDGNYVDVALNGVTLVAGTDYNTTTANTIGGLTALVASDVVEVIVYDTFSVFGGNMAANLNFKDNVKANFGTGNDLQIYHDAANSIINDAGTGNLQLQLGGSKKLEVTSTGVDVTGGLNTTDFDVIPTGSANYYPQIGGGVDGSADAYLALSGGTSGNGNLAIQARGTYGEIKFYTGGSSGSASTTERLRIDSSGNVGIGQTNPAYLLTAEGDKDTWISRIYNTGSDANASALLVRSDATAAHDAPVFGVYADSGYKFVVKSSGIVGIGTSAPSGAKLEIFTGSTSTDGLKINRFGSGVYYSTLRQDSHGLAIRVGDGSTIAERVAITPNGITFNGETAAAHALDDYEEGALSLSVSTGTASFGGIRYTKVGNLVTVRFYVEAFSDTSTASAIAITGLPYASSSSNQATGSILGKFANTIGGDAYISYVGTSSSTLLLFKTANNANYSQIEHSHLTSASAQFIINLTYEAA